MWILVLLVYSKVSGGEFYDTNNSATSSDAYTAKEERSHSVPVNHEANSDDEDNHINHDESRRQAEMNFLEKLKQRQRQRQFIPAKVMSSRERMDPHGLFVDLLENPENDMNDQTLFVNDLATVLRYLAQQRDETAQTKQDSFRQSSEEFSDNGQKRAAALRTTMSRRSHTFPYSKERFSPSISVGEFYGALTNLGDFFQHLKHNLESLETKNLSHDQVKLLEGENMISNLRKEFTDDYPKPAGSAAFLHAIRNYRPSNRIRALVSSVPDLYRGTNFHDPVYKLAGLGK